jgi:hypothetical protein
VAFVVQDERAPCPVCVSNDMAYLFCVHIYEVPALHRQGEADFRATKMATHEASPTNGDDWSNAVGVLMWPNSSIGDLATSEVTLELTRFVVSKFGALGRDAIEVCFSRIIACRVSCFIESTHFFFDGNEFSAEDLVSLCMFWISVTLCVLCNHMRVGAVSLEGPSL